VANSLDSSATTIAFTLDPNQSTLTVSDDGAGMVRRELARYHDLGSSAKPRGRGIGFAGVGIKLSLLAAQEVLTETRRGTYHVATAWHLASRHRAPWKWVPPPGLVALHGTAVRLKLANPLSPLLDRAFVQRTLRLHFQPLLDPTFAPILAASYPHGVRFLVDGEPIEPATVAEARAPLAIRVGRQRKPSALGYLVPASGPLPEERRGLAVSTLGKVIKRGWDWVGLSPAHADQLGGLIEIPALAECLMLAKGDFLRSGPRGALYLAYRKAVQQAVQTQLVAWGDTPAATDEARRRRTRPVERDLQAVLVDLADDFPLLASLVDRHPGGQRRLPMGRRAGAATAGGTVPASFDAPEDGAPQRMTESAPEAPPEEPEPAAEEGASLGGPALPGPRGPRRPAHYGLDIRFESRLDDPELGRLVESTVWVNEAHPAYRRAAATRTDDYHLALTVAMALAPLAVEPAETHGFVTAFLARWGEAEPPIPRRRQRRAVP